MGHGRRLAFNFTRHAAQARLQSPAALDGRYWAIFVSPLFLAAFLMLRDAFSAASRYRRPAAGRRSANTGAQLHAQAGRFLRAPSLPHYKQVAFRSAALRFCAIFIGCSRRAAIFHITSSSFSGARPSVVEAGAAGRHTICCWAMPAPPGFMPGTTARFEVGDILLGHT